MGDRPKTDDSGDLEARLARALEREAALRQTLGAISVSRADEAPVFDAILDNASRLCHAPLAALGLISKDGRHYELTAYRGVKPEFVEYLQQNPPDLDPTRYVAARAMVEMRAIHVDDLGDPDLYGASDKVRRQSVQLEGVRTSFYLPLILDGRAVGVLMLYRRVVSPFTADEIALVETFAAQAVIAIENARQFRELQTRLERESATNDVLSVISQSRSDDVPVFDAILKNAQALCGAPMSGLILAQKGDAIQTLAAQRGISEDSLDRFRQGGMPMDGNVSYAARCILEGRLVAFADMGESDLYTANSSVVRSMVDDIGIRSVLFVPLMKDGEAIGCITLFRLEIEPFEARHTELVETFAAQAVIAVENVRQFKALEALNAELGDRVKEQVGEIERMGRLKRFLPAAVADTVVSQGSEKMLASHRALLGVLFCDIRGFTAFCETAEPEETIEVLQSYHEEMGALIAAHGAGVDTRAGDGIMVLFNDPLPCDDPAGDALRLGLAMRARMQELCKGWRRYGHKLGFGVGISLGYATVGMVGSSGRYDYTASGTAVNLAARLCDKAADGEILLSPRAYTAVEDDVTAEAIGEIALKGIHAPVNVFRVSGLG